MANMLNLPPGIPNQYPQATMLFLNVSRFAGFTASRRILKVSGEVLKSQPLKDIILFTSVMFLNISKSS